MKLILKTPFSFLKGLLCCLILSGILSSCSQPTPVPNIPLFQPTLEPTPSLSQATPLPSRPIYAPGTLVDYVSQDGDSLAVIAKHFNTSLEEVIEANPLVPSKFTTLQAGTALKIPIYYKALWGSQYQILPDSAFILGPESVGFDTVALVNASPGWLKNYTVFAGNKMRTGGEVIDHVALSFSISPRLLLAIAEYQTGALSDPVMNPNLGDYPLGYEEPIEHKGFYLQLVWAANKLNNGYYGWRNGTLDNITRTDGTLEVPDPWQNAASVGIKYYFAQKLSYDDYIYSIYEDGLAKTYRELFGDPWVNSRPHIPGNLQQVDLVLPFPVGHKWAYTGGPHAAWWGEGEPYAAIDFAPGSIEGGCAPSNDFVVAMADGLIVRTDVGVAVLDLDMDGDERTGWVLYYLHLSSNDKVSTGTIVKAGNLLGHPSCEGGASTGTHIHIARKYNGEWMIADGMVPFDLEGWIPERGAAEYLGTLKRLGHVLTASQSSSGNSAITAGAR